jgi:hypothetical protein
VDHKARCRLHRTAPEDLDHALDRAVLVALGVGAGRACQQGRQRALSQRMVDGDAEGSGPVVAQQQNDAVMEARVLDRRRGDQ